MQRSIPSLRAQPRRSLRAADILVIAIALALVACGAKAGGAVAQGDKSDKSDKSDNAPHTGDPRVSACMLMPKEEVNTITGASYTDTKASDDAHSSSSGCHYTTASDPAGMSVNINWVDPSDYSDPAEHAALQRASMGGAKLGGKLTAGMPRLPGAPDGPIEGVGEEATVNMMMLTARKGDYTVMVQIIPTDMMAIMTDTTAAGGLVEKEKAVARKVLAKL